MPHTLILGMSGSGKSFLSKRLAVGIAGKGRAIAVLDPIGSKWACKYVTHKPDDFLLYARTNTNHTLFLDECGESLRLLDEDKNARDMHWIATRGRHLGHYVFFIAQRATQIPPTMRDQCESLYLFRVSVKDAAILADEFGKPFLSEAATLGKGEFFHVDRYGLQVRGRIDFQANSFTLLPIENSSNQSNSSKHRQRK